MNLIKEQFLKWHSEVERKIPCHFCSVKLSDEIYSCDFGHVVCHSCKTNFCIVCKKSFFRNHIAEFLISQLNILKSDIQSLDDSAIAVKKPDKKYKTKFSQTKNEQDNKIFLAAGKNIEKSIKSKSLDVKQLSEDEPKNNQDKPNNNLLNIYGFFSCWIGHDCYFKADYPTLLAHMKNTHSKEFSTQPFKRWPHVMSWDLNYNGANTREDRVFEIKDIGSFALHIFTINEQNLKAHIMMFDRRRVAAQFYYEMEIKSDDKKKSFSAVIDSSRLPRKILYDCNKGLFINQNSVLLSTIKMKMKYKCTVQIMKFNETNDKKNTGDLVNSQVEKTSLNKRPDNTIQKRDNQKPKLLNKNQFKPTRKNENCLKDKSDIPSLLDLKNINIAHCSSENPVQPIYGQNNSFGASGYQVNAHPPHLYPNLQKEFNYQQMQTHPHPHMVNSNYNMSVQPPMKVQPAPLIIPHPSVIKDQQVYQRNVPPQNLIVHELDNVGNQTFSIPTQPSAPVIDMEDFRTSNKPGNFTAADLKRQKSIQQQIEERERNRMRQSGATTFDTTQREYKTRDGNRCDFKQKKSNECVLC